MPLATMCQIMVGAALAEQNARMPALVGLKQQVMFATEDRGKDCMRSNQFLDRISYCLVAYAAYKHPVRPPCSTGLVLSLIWGSAITCAYGGGTPPTHTPQKWSDGSQLHEICSVRLKGFHFAVSCPMNSVL